MKFRNKNTGAVFEYNSPEFCSEYIKHDECKGCPIRRKRGHERCQEWILFHAEEAAALMGYELVTDETEAKNDAGKPRPTLVPVSLMEAVTAVREYGCAKYHDPENWRKVEPQRYRDALYRHWLAYLKDPTGVDAESGIPHLWHLACNVAFLIEMEQEEKYGKA